MSDIEDPALSSLTAGYQEHFVARDGGNVYARDYAGAGPAFVLLHGFPDNLGIYDFLVPHLTAAGRRVVTFDFLGFGASDKPGPQFYSFKQQMGDLVAVMDALGIDQAVPVAHDSAGAAAINLAIDHPERVASLVLLNCVFADEPPTALPELITLFATKSLSPLSMAMAQSPEQLGFILNFQRDQFQKGLSDAHKKNYKEFLGPLIDGNFRQQPSSGTAFVVMTSQFFAELARNTTRMPMMEALDMPVKIIWGDRDPYFASQAARDFHSLLKNSTLNVMDAGHWLQIDEPKQVADIMLA